MKARDFIASEFRSGVMAGVAGLEKDDVPGNWDDRSPHFLAGYQWWKGQDRRFFGAMNHRLANAGCDPFVPRSATREG